MQLYRTILPTPVGEMMALASDRELCALEFASKRRETRLDARRKRWFPPHTIEEGENGVTALTREWLDDYFKQGGHGRSDVRRKPDAAGEARRRRTGAMPPLAMYGTDFEQRVWNALLDIPPGETSTYGAIARQLGVPGASRAVGLANGSNPIAIIVPCHRVIGSSGSLTGYGGGLDRKRWLLAHERQKFAPSLLDL